MNPNTIGETVHRAADTAPSCSGAQENRGGRGMARVLLLVSSSLLCVLMLACGDSGDSPVTTPTATPAPGAASKPAASVQQISAEAKQCLDLVKQKRYVEAMDPCRRAIEDSGNADVKRAYDEAVAAAQQEAKSAAVKAAAGGLSGKSVDEAASDAAGDALRKFGGEAP